MAVVHASYYTDPASPGSWAVEPWRRRLEWEFGDELRITYVMTGIARTIEQPVEQLRAWLEAAAGSGMPVDPRLWLEAPPSSSYPACMAVKAAAEQGLEAPYLRLLREGFAVRRRKLDTTDALVDLGRGVPGMDADRLRIDLGSHGIVEAFGADLDRATTDAGDRIAGPWIEFVGEDGVIHGVGADQGLEGWRGAAQRAGAQRGDGDPPSVEDALRQLGPLATVEVAAVCDLPGPRAAASLWELAVQWRAQPERFVGGELWSAA